MSTLSAQELFDVVRPRRVVVAGSTRWTSREPIEQALDYLRLLAEQPAGSFRVLTGMADGADAIARAWATDNDVALVAEPLAAGTYPGPMHEYNEWMLSLKALKQRNKLTVWLEWEVNLAKDIYFLRLLFCFF